MEKQTKKPRLNVEAWNNYEQGYANALADVDDAIDRLEVRKLKHIKFRRPFIKGKSELKQEITHSQQGNASSVKGLRMQTDHAGKHDAGKQGLVGPTAPNPADANELRKNIKLLGEWVNLNSAEGEK